MSPTTPEMDKRPGVCYAFTDDGLELPVIDLTHPAFALQVSDEELSTLIDNFQRASKTPVAVLQSIAQKSLLVRGVVESADTFTTGINTYLNKLPPDLLGDGYANPLDRQWAASLTPLTFRWRLRDVVRLLADGLAAALGACQSCPVHLINIAGGPALDSLNALILLRREQPELLAGRAVTVHVLDLDPEGPRFGVRALAALQAEGAPLNGLPVAFNCIPYNWSEPSTLRDLLAGLAAGQVVAVGSSEGGLFEYASDADIVANLQALHAGTPPHFVMVGPVVRDAATLDPRLKDSEHVAGRPAIRYIGLSAFDKLAAQAGWNIARHLDGPMHQVVCLTKSNS